MAHVVIDLQKIDPKGYEYEYNKENSCTFINGTGRIWICGGLRSLCRPLFKEVGWKNLCKIQHGTTLTIHTKARGDYKFKFKGDFVGNQEHMGRGNQNDNHCLGESAEGTIKVSTG